MDSWAAELTDGTVVLMLYACTLHVCSLVHIGLINTYC